MEYQLINIQSEGYYSYTNAIVSLEGNTIVVYEDVENGSILGIFPTALYICTYVEPKG
jgi:hypothetical protein